MISFFFYLHLMVLSSHYTIFNITYDHSFVTFYGSIIFLLTFDGSIVTLRNTNITYDPTFVTFSGSPIFYSHLVF